MSQELLRKVYLFEEFPANELAEVMSLSTTDVFQKGDEVFAQKDQATALYIIKLGSVRIYGETANGDKIEVAMIGTGSHFGEMSLIDGEPRSATAEVAEKTEIVKISYDKLKKLLDSKPNMAAKFYKSISKFLSGRLRQTTTDLSFARELNLRHF
jgi:CRP-like cAMP-binding protein